MFQMCLKKSFYKRILTEKQNINCFSKIIKNKNKIFINFDNLRINGLKS